MERTKGTWHNHEREVHTQNEDIHCVVAAFFEHGGIRTKEAVANAEFACTAVNFHDRLVKAVGMAHCTLRANCAPLTAPTITEEVLAAVISELKELEE